MARKGHPYRDSNYLIGLIPFSGFFNGKDLDGWLFPERAGGLKFEDGVIHLTNENDYLLTKRNDFKNFLLRMELSASKGTEAFVVIRHQGAANAGTGITSLVNDDSTAIRAGNQALNFSPKGMGMKRTSTPYDQFFKWELSIKNRDTWIAVDETSTSGVNYPGWPGLDQGALGVVVRKGAVAVRKIEVKELPSDPQPVPPPTVPKNDAKPDEPTPKPPPSDSAKPKDPAENAKLSATEAFSLKHHTAAVTRVAYHRTMPVLASAGKDGRVLLWNLETHAPQSELHKFAEEVWAMKFSPKGQVLAYANRRVAPWAIESRTFGATDV